MPKFYIRHKIPGSALASPLGDNLVMAGDDITFTFGKVRHAEIGFRESKCPRCGVPFIVGEKISLMITYVYKGEDTKKLHTLARPIHPNCDISKMRNKTVTELRKVPKDKLLDFTAINDIRADYTMSKDKLIKLIKEAT